MLKQPTREVKDVNDLLFYKVEKRRIDKLNQALGKIKLTKKEEKTMRWLVRQDDETIDTIISAFAKAEEKRRKEYATGRTK